MERRITLKEDGTNFNHWKMITLAIYGLKYDSTVLATTLASDDLEPSPDAAENGYLLSLILLSIHEVHLPLVEQKSGIQAFAALNTNFNQPSSQSKVRLLQRFWRLSGHATIEELLLEFRTLANQLRATGHTIEEEVQIAAFLLALPTRFSQIRIAIELSDQDMTLNKVIQFVTDADQSTKKSSKEVSFNVSTEPPPPPTCAYCDFAGHTIKDCRKLKNKERLAKEAAAAQSQKSKMAMKANPATQNKTFAYYSPLSTFTNDWILDSGASAHLCTDASLLEDLHVLKKPITIHTASSGNDLTATKAGTLRFTNSNYNIVTIEDVLVVPGLTSNLISQGLLMEKRSQLL